jgi:argininosuccinate lyase
MPQKKNPDVCELVRGRAARVVGNLTALFVLVKGLPLAYNRDLQEDKEPLFEAMETVESCLALASIVVDGAQLRRERIAQVIEEGFLDATSLMEWLILEGVPQRTAHEVIGKLVALCESTGRTRLAELTDQELRAANPALGPHARECLGAANAISRFRSAGSTSPKEVADQLARWRTRLSDESTESPLRS